jgi:hypothetical protein
MFERVFQVVVRHGARILFALAVTMAACEIAYAAYLLSNVGQTGPSLAQQSGWWPTIVLLLHGGIAPPAYMLTAALVVHYLERWTAARLTAN